MTLPFRIAALGLALAAAPAAADVKIGYVDLQRALNEVDDGKAAKALLKRDFDEKQKQLNAKKDEFEKMRTDFEKQSVVMSEQAKRDKSTELDKRAFELQQVYQQLQQELLKREQEMTRGIFDKMSAIVKEIAEGDGFQMIFERNDAGLVYAPPSLDVTNELIRKYNSRYPAGSGAGAGTAAKPKAAAPKAPGGEKPPGEKDKK
jgi:outer membrane protein